MTLSYRLRNLRFIGKDSLVCWPSYLRYMSSEPPGKKLNDYLLSVLLGIVEGLTEFLPVSSTAHLRLVEELMHVPLSSGYWKMYSIVIQLGAILVLPIYFRSTLPN